jgi:capsular exopolysaccharide synthesis family protein
VPTNENKNVDTEEKLPFDPRTLFLSLLLRWRYLLGITIVFTTLGVVAAIMVGSPMYEAETVLLYGPSDQEESDSGEMPSLHTQKNLVKIHSNLEETRRRLNLTATLQQIGSSVEVLVQANTDLMIIRARWNSAENASAIANTLRDVFLSNQRSLRGEDAKTEMLVLEKRINKVIETLEREGPELSEFTTTNKVVELDRDAQRVLEELISIDILLGKAELKKKTIDIQVANIDKVIKILKDDIIKEKDSASKMETLGDVNIRSKRLRDSIHDDKQYRANMAALSQKEAVYERASRLWAEGLISKSEYDEAKAGYEKEKALTVDTDQVKKWKNDISKLEKIVIPSNASHTPSGRLLQGVMLKDINIQLEQVALEEKVRHLKKLHRKVKQKLEAMPALKRKHIALSSNAKAGDAVKHALEEHLEKARIKHENEEATGFTIVSVAAKPVFPIKSNRRLIFFAVSIFGTVLGFGIILLIELVDTTIKSPADIQLKISIPMLGAINKLSDSDPVFPDKTTFEPMEVYRVMARHIRNVVPKKGARILIASAYHQEGKTAISANLALCFGRMDERVLLLDTQIRPEETSHSLLDLIQDKVAQTQGLGEYLSYEADKVEEVIYPTILPGVECLPRVSEAVIPDLLGSNRMQELLEEASRKYSIVLLDSSPSFPYVDAETIAQFSDAVVFVVRSRTCKLSKINDAIERLKKTNPNIIGTILNAVDSLYIDSKLI